MKISSIVVFLAVAILGFLVTKGGTSGAQRVAGGGTPSPREHRVSKTSLLSYDIVVDLFPFSGSHKIERSFLLAIGHTVCSKEVAGIQRQTHKSA
jgi:hypothetical protein